MRPYLLAEKGGGEFQRPSPSRSADLIPGQIGAKKRASLEMPNAVSDLFNIRSCQAVNIFDSVDHHGKVLEQDLQKGRSVRRAFGIVIGHRSAT